MAAQGLLLLLALLGGSPSAAPSEQDQKHPPAVCVAAADAFERGDLEQARKMYLDGLGGGSEACAIDGLKRVTRREGRVAGLCSRGKLLAAEGKDEAAKRRFAVAFRLDGESECAQSGLSPPAPEKEEEGKSGVSKAADWMADLAKLLGAGLGLLLLGLAGLLILLLLWWHRKPSLSIESFADGAVEPKVGSTVAALVEGHLTAVSRRRKGRNDGLLLDLVVADVELLATNKGLDTALSGLAEVSQLKLLVTLAGLIDRLGGKHLVARGELVLKGAQGHGLVVALQSEKNGVEAREALWKKLNRASPKNPTPYYELAEPAAAWIQYETACSLDSRFRLITRNAQSFSLLSLGLAEQRARRFNRAVEHYAAALRHDPENVAALFNLGRILVTTRSRVKQGYRLVVRALLVLESRYEEIE
jgi:tetratricopeptide (TPR) repeat protein